MQRINRSDLLFSNLRGSFYHGFSKTFVNADPENPAGCVLLILLLAALPVALAASAGIKTAVDIHTRHPLSESDMQNLINTISQLDDDQFDTLVANMSKYKSNAKSNSSNTLLALLDKLSENTNTQTRQIQRDAIIGYLKDNKNVGKKMQHIVMEETNRFKP